MQSSNQFQRRRACLVTDTAGTVLTEAEVQWVDGGALAVLKPRSRGALLSHYFGRGRRMIVISSPPFRIAGRLRTRWEESQRRWWMTPVSDEAAVTASGRARTRGTRPGDSGDADSLP